MHFIALTVLVGLAGSTGERKGNEGYLYSAIYTMHSLKALRHGSHSFTCKLHHACLTFVSVHQMAQPITWSSRHPIAAYYSLIDPEWMKGWVCLFGWPSGRFTHISGHPSATGRAQDRESLPAKDRRSTTEPRNLLYFHKTSQLDWCEG